MKPFSQITVAEFLAMAWPVGKLVYVDATNGSDTKGGRGKGTAFKTLTAAKTAATSGDTIIVLPGTYTENNLLKNGVNWHFLAGAIVNYVDPGTGSGYGIFDDRPTGACVSTISGDGEFKYYGYRVITVGILGMCNVTNAGSTIYFQCKRVDYTTEGGNNSGAFWIQNCTKTVIEVKGDISDPWRGILITDPSDPEAQILTQCSALYWEIGECDFRCNRINMSWYGIYGAERVGNVTPYNLYARVNYMDTEASCLYVVGQTSSYRVWLEGLLFKSVHSALLLYSAGKYYVTAQKLETTGTGNGVIEVNSGSSLQAWITAQKITGAATCFRSLAGAGTTSKIWINAMQLEDSGTSTSLLDILTTGGQVFLNGAFGKITNGKGILKTGTQELRLSNTTLDTSTTNAAANRPVDVSQAGLILDNCVLVAPAAADSIGGGTATVKIYGTTVTNKAKNATITTQVTALTVDANVS